MKSQPFLLAFTIVLTLGHLFPSLVATLGSSSALQHCFLRSFWSLLGHGDNTKVVSFSFWLSFIFLSEISSFLCISMVNNPSWCSQCADIGSQKTNAGVCNYLYHVVWYNHVLMQGRDDKNPLTPFFQPFSFPPVPVGS